VLKALGGSGVPVPTVRLHCEDTSVIGSEFFVMDWVKGRIFLDPSLPGMAPAERRAVFTDYLKVLARLHAIDPAAVGLADYGRPGNYYERQISRWVRQYKAAQTDDHPDMERLMAWLPAHMPAQSETRIVHGDFSIRNCMLHPTEPKLEAVLDWELSTLGDPYSDVAYTTLFMMGETPQKTITDLGIPSQAEMFEIYAEASGLPSGLHPVPHRGHQPGGLQARAGRQRLVGPVCRGLSLDPALRRPGLVHRQRGSGGCLTACSSAATAPSAPGPPCSTRPPCTSYAARAPGSTTPGAGAMSTCTTTSPAWGTATPGWPRPSAASRRR